MELGDASNHTVWTGNAIACVGLSRVGAQHAKSGADVLRGRGARRVTQYARQRKGEMMYIAR
eukprot:2005483-Rhodomonas_salina.1